MAAERELIENTITALKKFRKRKAYESESDEEIANRDNRGQKLKKRARFVRHGQLAPPTGPEVYREVVNHAGFERTIISRNPPLINDEGYELDPDDDEDQIQDLLDSVANSDPYASLRLEHILAPLTSVTDLSNHPTLSRPYTSQTLSDLAHQGSDLMHKENAALWKIKRLQTRLNGDHTWAPSELMIGANDLDFFESDYISNVRSDPSKGSVVTERSIRLIGGTQVEANSSNGRHSVNGIQDNRDGQRPSGNTDSTGNGDGPKPDQHKPNVDKKGIDELATSELDGVRPEQLLGGEKGTELLSTKSTVDGHTAMPPEGAVANSAPDTITSNGRLLTTENGHDRPNDGSADEAQLAAATMSTTAEVPSNLYIHPLFLAPRSARPDRDLGLPEAEAEEVRRLLQAFVQKQEEVCRGSKRLYEGLLRADRLRKQVFQWSKYEAHAGPNRDMSDGEDWYDKEEWGLEEDLKKGQDEEEEDTTQPAKKTRARR